METIRHCATVLLSDIEASDYKEHNIEEWLQYLLYV